MLIKDLFGNGFRLSAERWQHIGDRHPELRGRQFDIATVLFNPDLIVQSYNDPTVYIYHQKEKIRYYLVVVVHSKDKFVITAFITDKIKIGKIIWLKKNSNN